MAARLLAAGGALLAVIALIEVMLNLSAGSRRINVGPDSTSTIEYNLNKARPPALWPSWRVTQANSAHDVLVVNVEARRLEQAGKIAEAIVEPVRSRGYLEILIYVHQAGNPDGAMRRVQWTQRTGFVETAYGAPR